MNKKRLFAALLALLVGMQLRRIDMRNPSIDFSKTIYEKHAPSKRVHDILDLSCADCHSNRTHWPWYGHIAPISWIVANDVKGGRRAMNFSEWESYSADKQERTAEKICEQVMNGSMPPAKYAFVHRAAKLADEERDAVCEWSESLP